MERSEPVALQKLIIFYLYSISYMCLIISKCIIFFIMELLPLNLSYLSSGSNLQVLGYTDHVKCHKAVDLIE